MAEKIKGYRDLEPVEIEMINECKHLAILCGTLTDKLKNIVVTDKRWVAIGTTDLQTGFMALVRSIARPETF